MVSAGNIRDLKELDEVLDLSVSNLVEYLDYLENDIPTPSKLEILSDYTKAQNRYCHFQKQNPHTPRVMESLGYDPDTVNSFIQTCLFPEI